MAHRKFALKAFFPPDKKYRVQLWRPAADLRRKVMPTGVARQKMFRVEPEVSSLLPEDLSPEAAGSFWNGPF